MSISNMLIADMRAVVQDTHHGKVISIMNNLNSKWDAKDLMPPYIESIANYFPANIMKKNGITTQTQKGAKPTTKKAYISGSRT